MKEIKVFIVNNVATHGNIYKTKEEIFSKDITGRYKERNGEMFVEVFCALGGKAFVSEEDIIFEEEEIFECSTSAGNG